MQPPESAEVPPPEQPEREVVEAPPVAESDLADTVARPDQLPPESEAQSADG